MALLIKTQEPEVTYFGAKSICYCGHTGDGPASDHGGLNGHGPCEIHFCDCAQFTWKDFLQQFKDFKGLK